MKEKTQGFTLIELAISLMVIGLLIGGVLKGQELIDNAKIIKTVRMIKSYDAAVLIFKDTYDALPGDIINPERLIPNCTTLPCRTSGDGDGKIIHNFEQANFWLHMERAGLLSGLQPDIRVGLEYGSETPFGGIFTLLDEEFPRSGSLHKPISGNAFMIFPGFEYDEAGELTGGLEAKAPLKAKHIAGIDRKIDDGKPYSGNFVYIPWSSDAACVNNATLEYNEADQSARCAAAFFAGF